MGELQKTVLVKDKEYIIQRFKGEQAFAIKFELGKLVVPFIKDLQEARTAEDEEGRMGKILVALQHMLESTDYQTALRLLKTLVSQVYNSSGQKIVPDDEFTQNLMSWYQLAWEVIIFNYEDVFSGLGFNSNPLELNRG